MWAAVVSYMSEARHAPHAKSNADLLPDWCVCVHGLEHITGFRFQCLLLRIQAGVSGVSFTLIPRVSCNYVLGCTLLDMRYNITRLVNKVAYCQRIINTLLLRCLFQYDNCNVVAMHLKDRYRPCYHDCQSRHMF